FREGQFDILQQFSQTAERDAYADFSVPYLTLRGALFVRKRDNPIRHLEDLTGRRFAISGVNSIGERFLRDRGLTVEIVQVDSSEEGLRALDRGDVDAVFVSHLTALAAIEHSRLENIAMFGQPFSDYDIRHCFAVHKGDSQLLARLNEGLALLHRNGEYQAIYDRWFGRFEPRRFTREQVALYVALALSLALIAVTWGFLRQRSLRRHLARQASELASQQGVLQALYDNVPFAMCVLDLENGRPVVLSANRRAELYLGAWSRDAAGRTWGDLPVDPAWREAVMPLLARIPAPGEFVREEKKLAQPRRTLLISLVPLSPGPDGHRRVCVLTEDVTTRRMLDDEVAQSRKLRALGELVGGIAHEFNNLLTPIMLKVSTLQLERTDDRRYQDDLGLMMTTLKRAADLTRRLLAFGRRSEARAENIPLAATVDNCIALLQQTIDRRIRITSSLPVDVPTLTGNATSVSQILLNLLLNARDTLAEKLAAKPDGWTPHIEISAVRLPAAAVTRPAGRDGGGPAVEGWLRLSVHDNGLGMSPDVRERIFEPFYTTKEVGKGTGLGLATVWHLAAEMGGRIEVDSIPGEGSTFHILLPIHPAAGPSSRNPITDRAPARAGARIFLAEDDDLVAQSVVAALEDAGYAITREGDGLKAWDHLKTHPTAYDLLVLDVNMPGLDGLEVARRVRGAGYAGRILVISGRIDPADTARFSAAGVDAVLPKPFGLEHFLSAVRAALAARAPSG
ncbi:MAG TPA: transporter substrate-binding domain-containing protein, partial [Opitutaceae bacterium]|nr:transporter substrate-binding domain-containing protein [Opitutaceae bacterium]